MAALALPYLLISLISSPSLLYIRRPQRRAAPIYDLVGRLVLRVWFVLGTLDPRITCDFKPSIIIHYAQKQMHCI